MRRVGRICQPIFLKKKNNSRSQAGFEKKTFKPGQQEAHEKKTTPMVESIAQESRGCEEAEPSQGQCSGNGDWLHIQNKSQTIRLKRNHDREDESGDQFRERGELARSTISFKMGREEIKRGIEKMTINRGSKKCISLFSTFVLKFKYQTTGASKILNLKSKRDYITAIWSIEVIRSKSRVPAKNYDPV